MYCETHIGISHIGLSLLIRNRQKERKLGRYSSKTEVEGGATNVNCFRISRISEHLIPSQSTTLNFIDHSNLFAASLFVL